MNFGDFLHHILEKRSISSISQLYIEFGGEEELQMSLRNFNFIAAGKQKPSVSAFNLIFNHLEKEEQKLAIESFFQSFPCNEKICTSIKTNFIEKYEKPTDSLSKIPNRKKISGEQLSYIMRNHRTIQLHHYMVLFDEINLKNIEEESDLKIFEDFVKIGLAKKENNKIIYINPSSRLPTSKDSPPNEVRQTSNLVIETMKAFLSFEGSEQQTLEYFCGNINRENAVKIHEELIKIKKLVQTVGEVKTSEQTVPMIGVLFGKTLLEKDLL